MNKGLECLKSNIVRVSITVVLFFVSLSSMIAQSVDDEIKSSIEKLEKGQTEEVKQELPKLAAKYQNNPAVLYLQGRLASDGTEAVKFYQSIVDNFPKSEWADDALYRIYQYYYALGLYRTAELKMLQLKKEYPHSPYTAGKSQTKLPKQDEVAINLPVKEPSSITPPQPAETERETTSSSTKPVDVKAVEVAGQYTLQVGAFSTVTNAEKQKSFFEDLGYTVEITNKVRNGRSLYLVWAGNYKTAEEAKRAGREVKAKYKIDSIAIERY